MPVSAARPGNRGFTSLTEQSYSWGADGGVFWGNPGRAEGVHRGPFAITAPVTPSAALQNPGLVALLCHLLGTGQGQGRTTQGCDRQTRLWVLFSNIGTGQTLAAAGGTRFPGGTGAALPVTSSREHSPALRAQRNPAPVGSGRILAPTLPRCSPRSALTELPAAQRSVPGAARAALFPALPAHSMAASCCPSTSRVLEFTSSLRISGEICGWLWNLSSSSKASFCSEDRSSL